MPLVLDTLVYADRLLLAAHPELAQAQVYVHFQSTVRELDTVEYWGLLSDRASWPKGPTSILLRVIYAVVGWPPSLSALPADLSIDLPAELRDVEEAVRQQQQALEDEQRRVAMRLRGDACGSEGSMGGREDEGRLQGQARAGEQQGAAAAAAVVLVECLISQEDSRAAVLAGQDGAEEELSEQQQQLRRSWQHGRDSEAVAASCAGRPTSERVADVATNGVGGIPRSCGEGAAGGSISAAVGTWAAEVAGGEGHRFGNTTSGHGATSSGRSSDLARMNGLNGGSDDSSDGSRSSDRIAWSSRSGGGQGASSSSSNGNGTVACTPADDLSRASPVGSASAADAAQAAAGGTTAAPTMSAALGLGANALPPQATSASVDGSAPPSSLLAGRPCSSADGDDGLPCSGEGACSCEGPRATAALDHPAAAAAAAGGGGAAEGVAAAAESHPQRAAGAGSSSPSGGSAELRVGPCVVTTERGLELAVVRAAARSPSAV